MMAMCWTPTDSKGKKCQLFSNPTGKRDRNLNRGPLHLGVWRLERPPESLFISSGFNRLLTPKRAQMSFFKFRKRIKLLPGLWMNVFKKGVSLSAGVKGFTVNSRGRITVRPGRSRTQTPESKLQANRWLRTSGFLHPGCHTENILTRSGDIVKCCVSEKGASLLNDWL
jgi:hypothetical protein